CGHRWVALVGTGGWAQVSGTAGHRWVALLCTGVCDTAERHRWVHCWAQVGDLLGTGGRKLAGGGTAGLTVHQGTDHQCPDDRCRSPL
ncbi:unnamed protein product, partial [Staurois parvus]